MEKLKKIWRFLTAPEMLLYILFGILTTAVNILSFGLLRDVLQWQLLTANTLAWVLSVAFAFLTNKVFVFRSKSFAAKLVLRELVSFVGARLFSLAVDTAGVLTWVMLVAMVDWLAWNKYLAKVFVSAVNLILNYVFSKLFIFKRPQ